MQVILTGVVKQSVSYIASHFCTEKFGIICPISNIENLIPDTLLNKLMMLFFRTPE